MEVKQTGSLLSAATALTTLGGEQEHNLNKFAQKDESDDEAKMDNGDCNAKIFPQRLFEVLSDEGSSESICWLPHGKGFIIKDRKRFANEVLPKYFRQTKFTSFTRKLNRWNFTRVTRGPEIGAYYHKFFQRGNAALCTQMYCKNERAKFARVTQQGEQPPVTRLPMANDRIPSPMSCLTSVGLQSPVLPSSPMDQSTPLEMSPSPKLLLPQQQQQQSVLFSHPQGQPMQDDFFNAAIMAMYRDHTLRTLAMKSNPLQLANQLNPMLQAPNLPLVSPPSPISPAAHLQFAMRNSQGPNKFSSFRASAA